MSIDTILSDRDRLNSEETSSVQVTFIKRKRISVKLKPGSTKTCHSYFNSHRNSSTEHYTKFWNLSTPLSKSTVILGTFLILTCWLQVTYGRQNVFSNEFAVLIPAGSKMADSIAKKYGYENHGQIGSLPNYYLFLAHRVLKRSVEISHEHHAHLTDEPQVHWFEQQVQKKRVKRDFSYFDVTAGSGSGPGFYSPQSFLSQQSNQNSFADPLYPEQWYLTGGSKDGFDMNVQTAWKRGFSGKGVTVSILDDGIQTNHPDLLQNYDPRASTDINDNDNDPTPQDNGDNKHGTRCAGEVAATAGNNICGVGVAYNASIGGVRMLDGTVNDAVEAKALGLNPDHIDIYSASWGPEDDGKTVDGPGPLARRAFIYGVSNGRRGLGSIFIWASGNGGRHVDSCNCDGYTNSIFTLSISSATQGGYKPWYLEECASTLATTFSSGTPTLDKSVATVDMDGRLRPDHICTVEHTGTSASAPLAAGIAALTLEANKNLSWRDLQHLVVITSRPNPLDKEEGWYINGVKRKFSHKFGYGLMDAGAMVDLAVSWAGVPPQHICKSREIREDREIPGNHLGKVKVFMDVDGCAGSNSEIRFLEHVQCKISLRFFPRGNLRIQLTSPMGTTSVLLFERPRDVSSSNFDDWPFLSVHFWGEQAHGRWTLEVINSGSRRINQPGMLKKWQLILYGTDVNPVRVRTRSLSASPQPPPRSFPSNQPPPHRQPLFESIPSAQQHYTQYQPIVTRQQIPPEYLYPGASETVSQVQKQPTARGLCQNDYWVSDLSTCLNGCPEGYYNNDTYRRECYSCSPRCKACYNSSSCTACEHNLVLFGTTCVPNCPEGYFEADSSCEKCPLGACALCAGAMGNECVRCKNQLVLHQGNCLPHCPGGFRPTTSNDCVSCPTGCHSCDETKCLRCSNGFTFNDYSICVLENPVCPDGLFLDNDTNQCLGCGNEDCVQCQDLDKCLECQTGLSLNNGTCVRSCSDGFYLAYNNMHCFSCPGLCTKCTSADVCIECRPDGMLQGQKCLPHCLNGYYNDLGVCRHCSPACKTCVGLGDSECVTCNFGYNYTRGGFCTLATNTVFKESKISYITEKYCGDGYWLDRVDNSCQPCHRSCSKCTGGHPSNCRSCIHPLRLDRSSSRCIECCQNLRTQDDCCHCDKKRYAQNEQNPLTRNSNAECHFVSRRVSESGSSEHETNYENSSDSSLLNFCWFAIFVVIVGSIVVLHQRRKQRNLSPRHNTNEFDGLDFRSRKIRRKYKNRLYTPVNSIPQDAEEQDIRSCLIESENNAENQSELNSDDENGVLVKPLVLNT